MMMIITDDGLYGYYGYLLSYFSFIFPIFSYVTYALLAQTLILVTCIADVVKVVSLWFVMIACTMDF